MTLCYTYIQHSLHLKSQTIYSSGFYSQLLLYYMGTILIFSTTIQLCSSFLYSIYIYTEIIYTSPIYPLPVQLFFPHFFLCPFRAFFIFRAAYIPSSEKNFSEKKLVRKKIFLFLRKKFLLFWKSPRKKLFFIQIRYSSRRIYCYGRY